jgi:hypothetical protein
MSINIMKNINQFILERLVLNKNGNMSNNINDIASSLSEIIANYFELDSSGYPEEEITKNFIKAYPDTQIKNPVICINTNCYDDLKPYLVGGITVKEVDESQLIKLDREGHLSEEIYNEDDGYTFSIFYSRNDEYNNTNGPGAIQCWYDGEPAASVYIFDKENMPNFLS